MTAAQEVAPSMVDTNVHDPPVYQAAVESGVTRIASGSNPTARNDPSTSSTTNNAANNSTSRTRSRQRTSSTTRPGMPGLKLSRTHSHREMYDAESASMSYEFGSYSSQSPMQQRQPPNSTGGSTNRRPDGSYSHARKSSRGRDAGSKIGEDEENGDDKGLSQYISRDARQRAQEATVLEEVKSGHSGESVVDGQVERRAPATTASADVDLEKQEKPDDKGLESSSTTSDSHPISSRRPSATSSTSPSDTLDEKEKDENLVTWDSPDSMENPRNWSLHRRWAVIAIVSSYTFLSPLSSSMIAPALPTISAEFNITSSVLESLMLSVFVLAYAIGPLFLAPLSEMFGRRIVLQLSNAFFIVFTVACAVAQNRVQLSIFRFFAGLGGSAPLTIGGGTVSDLMLPDERGLAMAIYSLGPLCGPAIGPLIGGWLIQETGNWRWIFGVACIAAGVTASIGLFILPETYAPKILGKKAARLRKETRNDKLHTVFDENAVTWQNRFRHNMVRPFVLMGTQPIIMVLGVYLMIIYGCMYLILTSFSSVFEDVYGESVGIASLNYLSLAIGFTAGGQICGRLNDRLYKRLRANNGGVGQPEYKLPVMMATCWCPAVGLLIYGWTAEYKTHWIGPNIGAFILAFGMISTFQAIQTYTVDTYTLYAASALSANTFLRSLAGFALPLASGSLYQSLGYGYGNTVLGLIAAVIGIPAPFLLFKFGQRIRARSQYATG